MARYAVRYERDPSGWWVVTIPEIQGCRTQGRSLAEGRRRIRDALSLFVGEAAAERATLVDDATRAAVGELTRRAGLSVRDAAEMLGISFQRVQQLAGDE